VNLSDTDLDSVRFQLRPVSDWKFLEQGANTGNSLSSVGLPLNSLVPIKREPPEELNQQNTILVGKGIKRRKGKGKAKPPLILAAPKPAGIRNPEIWCQVSGDCYSNVQNNTGFV
jgi:hypothetical protein